MISNDILKCIKSEPILKNADGSYVSLAWVKKRRAAVIRNKDVLIAFALYDVQDDNAIYIHMLYVKPGHRKEGLGKYIIRGIMSRYSNMVIYGYANKNSLMLLKECGMHIGKTEYRECYFKPKGYK